MSTYNTNPFDDTPEEKSSVDTLVEILRRRDCNPMQQHGSWWAQCPAHEDAGLSLSFNADSEGTLFPKCAEGCDLDDILNALYPDEPTTSGDDDGPPGSGSPPAPGKGQSGKKRSAGYTDPDEMMAAAFWRFGREQDKGWLYHNADGEVVAAILRWNLDDGTKTIRQMSRDAVDGLWRAEKMQGIQPLYRLPNLLEADADEVVYVAEGEKAADAAVSLGLLATTHAGGSSAPLEKIDWSPLDGRRVVVLSDHDEVGRKWAKRLQKHLETKALGVRVVDLVDRWPELQKGDDVADLLELADADTIVAGIRELMQAGDPEPLPAALLPVPSFNPDWLPDAFRGWCIDVADRMQCPLDFVAVPALNAYAGAIGARLCIRPKELDRWEVVPNLWGGVVGSPGAMKSPALAGPRRILERLNREAVQANEEAEADYAISLAAYEADEKAIKKKMADAAKAGKKPNMDHAKQQLAELVKPVEPIPRRYVVNDATPEMLHTIMADNPQGITLFRDEIPGWLAGLEKQGREQERAFALEAWNGDAAFGSDRIGRGAVHAERVCLTIFGGIQPGPLAAYVRDAGSRGAGADGLLQRFQLLTWPDHRPGEWRNVDRLPDAEAAARAEAAYRRAATAEPDTLGGQLDDDAGPGAIPHLRFNPEALSRFRTWHAGLEAELSRESLETWSAWLSKMRSLVPSLALLVHVADASEPGAAGHPHLVTDEALQRALELAEYFKAHARRVLLSERREPVERAGRILERLEAGDLPARFTLRDLGRKGWAGIGTAKEAAIGVDLLVDLGHLVEHVEPEREKGKGGRPPSPSYTWRRVLFAEPPNALTQLTKPPVKAAA